MAQKGKRPIASAIDLFISFMFFSIYTYESSFLTTFGVVGSATNMHLLKMFS